MEDRYSSRGNSGFEIPKDEQLMKPLLVESPHNFKEICPEERDCPECTGGLLLCHAIVDGPPRRTVRDPMPDSAQLAGLIRIDHPAEPTGPAARATLSRLFTAHQKLINDVAAAVKHAPIPLTGSFPCAGTS
ncbi:hypothetical protein MRS44_000530 [Fusarium solani]|uniref:uncharacterized protein n=1 Tax=Fusarium solani TaxID=169388 RepID=UPI0032C46B6E|nr:hypothetical protein MRS44_000530 [Fusarium solani]